MFRYLRFGTLPPRHHITQYSPEKVLLNEYCFTRQGFEDCYSILYLYNPPTEETEIEVFNDATWSRSCKRKNPMLQRRHFESNRFESKKGFITGRLSLAFNNKLNYGLCHHGTPRIAETVYAAWSRSASSQMIFARS